MSKAKKLTASAIPAHGRLPLLLALALNMTVYSGARLIAGGWSHYNMETALDRMLPFWPASAAVYLGCYLFWAANYILIARQEKEAVYRFFAADFLSRLICLAFFLLLPTTNTRPVVEGDGFWEQVMRLVYSVDAADNLFPSIHCLVSWFCYIGIKDRADIPAGYKRFSCIMAVLVCLSTLTTKQHVLADVAAGILLAQVCFRLGKLPSVHRPYARLIDRLNGLIFAHRKGGPHANEKESAD